MPLGPREACELQRLREQTAAEAAAHSTALQGGGSSGGTADFATAYTDTFRAPPAGALEGQT